ncbi:MAG: hypothetical protein FH761_02355 [Firmicutes bacterium]|nr:hypothetical protein [Bacillota bacterium]
MNVIKSIRVLSSDLELLAEIDDYESLVFERSYHDIGEFQIVISKDKQNVDKLQKNNIIIIGDDTKKAGIIKYRQIQEDDKGIETLKIKGYQLKHMTTQRIVIPPEGLVYDQINGDTESVMKHYVNNHISNPVESDRKIDLVQVQTNQNRGEIIEWKSRFNNLGSDLIDISSATNIGWEMFIDYNTKKIMFDVIEGRDLTTSQSINPPAIFSRRFDNIKSQNYIDSDIKTKNVVYVGGKGEGIEREIVTVGDVTGLDRIETFSDSRNNENISDLIVHGERALNDLKTKKTLEAEILTISNLEYQKDYDLGDIVTIRYESEDITLHSRIIQIEETYEPGGFKLGIVFGNKVPTLTDKIKSQLKQIQPELTR